MRYGVTLLAGLLLASTNLQGQQAQVQNTPMPEPPIVVYRIDLVPTGFGLAMNEPKLEGDVYVFYSLPERTISRLPKSRVKKITRRSTDLNKEVIWQIDLNPTGRMLLMQSNRSNQNRWTSTWTTPWVSYWSPRNST